MIIFFLWFLENCLSIMQQHHCFRIYTEVTAASGK